MSVSVTFLDLLNGDLAVSNLKHWIWMSELARNVSLTIAGVVASCVGVLGLRSWRKQKMWERKLEVAEKVIQSFHQAAILVVDIQALDHLSRSVETTEDRREREQKNIEIAEKTSGLRSELSQLHFLLRKSLGQSQFLFRANVRSLISQHVNVFKEIADQVSNGVRSDEKVSVDTTKLVEIGIKAEFLILSELYGGQ